MFHQQWLKNVQSLLGEIRKSYPEGSEEEREKCKQRIRQIKKSCDDLLHSWAIVEDEIMKLGKQYPELLSDEEEICEEEFLLDQSMVRQFRQGQGYYQLAMYHQAIPLFEELVQREPDFLLARVYLGLCYIEKSQLQEAKYQFRMIIHTASDEAFIGFAHHMLGCIYVQENADHMASKQFSQAITRLPENSDAWFNLAACQYRLERYEEAIPCFFHALSLDGDDWESMFYLSKCYYQSKQYESVSFWRLQAYEKMKHPQIIQAIALDYEEKQNYEEALSWYLRLHAQDRKNCTAYQGIAWNTWNMAKTEEAICWLKKGLTLHPQDPYLLFFYFWVLLQQGKMKQAESVTRMIPNQVIKDPVWVALQSRFFSQIGDYQQAIRVAEHLIKQNKQQISALGYYHKGKVLMETGRTEDALQNFQLARQQIQDWQDPLFFEGMCHLLQEQPNQTRKCWEKIDLYL